MINLPIIRKPELEKPDKVIKTVYCLYRVSTKNQVDDCDIPMLRTACSVRSIGTVSYTHLTLPTILLV